MVRWYSAASVSGHGAFDAQPIEAGPRFLASTCSIRNTWFCSKSSRSRVPGFTTGSSELACR